MTQEEKELLLKDLYARLPYNVIVRVEVNDVFIKPTDEIATTSTINMFGYAQKFRITPYLRSPENLSDEEKDYWHKLQHGLELGGNIDLMMDFYHSHHIDYHGLIPKGLALEAPNNMYKI